MNNVRGTQLTYEGLKALARANIGEHLHFTRVVMGDGMVTDEQNLRELTGLISPRFELPIKDVRVTGIGTSVIESELKNISLKEGFIASEIGIFATIGDDAEILYAIRNTGLDSEFIPAGGGEEVWDMLYGVITVIGQAQNVTADINGDIAYVTRLDFYEHRDALHPHPNTPNLKEQVTDTTTFWAQKDNDNHLHPINIDDARRVILGGEASTLPSLKNRVSQLERETAHISLALTAQNIFPDYTLLLSEDFVVPDKIDTFICRVSSIVAGDNGIDIENMAGIVPGAWYTVTDGINQEYIQIRSCIKNGSVYRIIANKDIEYTYLIPQTYILRSTAQIGEGIVYGSGDKRGFLWQPSLIWRGVNSNVATTVPLETTQSNADLFERQGEVEFSSSGYFTLSME